MKTYTGKIVDLKSNQRYCFGANTQGRHGKGAALIAKIRFGAIQGVPKGPQGQSYAIVTKDLTKKVHPSISKEYIIEQIKELYQYADYNSELEFFIIYSGTGHTLNAYTPEEMAIMYSCSKIPDNFVFEEEFAKLLILE